jgi:hypothetical protein
MLSNLFVFLAFLIFFQTGCSSSAEKSLKLESVLDYKARRAQQAQLLASSPAPAAAPAVSPSPTPSPSLDLQPKELQALPLPPEFILMKAEELQDAEFQERFKDSFPALSAAWKVKAMNFFVLAAVFPLDQAELDLMTKRDFLSEVKNTGDQFDVVYQKRHKAQASSRVTEENGVTTLTIQSKYLEDGVWKADQRMIYFYTPEYRLNLLFTGTEDAWLNYGKTLQKSLQTFEEKLRGRYARPFAFREEDPAGVA